MWLWCERGVIVGVGEKGVGVSACGVDVGVVWVWCGGGVELNVACRVVK